MKAQWLQLNEKFLQLSPREMVLIVLSGLVLFIMVPFSLMIDDNLASINDHNKKIAKTSQNNKSLDRNIHEFSQALLLDPNEEIKNNITQLEKRLAKVDEQLLLLTEELIDPIEMRQALTQLLKLQSGVSIQSFEVLPAEPIIFLADKAEQSTTDKSVTNSDEKLAAPKNNASGLYRHGMRLTLNGRYFQLRDYLQQLENLPWKFFWHDFQYQLLTYPKSELKIEIYSLSTNQEFVGV